MSGQARLFVTFHPIGYHTVVLDDLRRAADAIERGTALLQRLADAGWKIEFDGVDDGIAEYSAVHEFASPLEALDAAATLGAHGRMFEWPGELDYLCVDDGTRQWLLAGSDAAAGPHQDQLSMF